jgi:hypothetical protein
MACYGDSFTPLYVDDVCTSLETPSLSVTGIALLFILYYIILYCDTFIKKLQFHLFSLLKNKALYSDLELSLSFPNFLQGYRGGGADVRVTDALTRCHLYDLPSE